MSAPIRAGLGRLKRLLLRAREPVDLGRLDRVEPVSRVFGFDRGTPVDRRYIERFLATHAERIRGRSLEVADAEYTTRFGGTRVTRRDVLHAREGAPGATLIGSLSEPDTLPENVFDCFVCTQTLNVIYDVKRAVEGSHRLLRPGGALLLTVAGISQISRYDRERWGVFWGFTPESIERLLKDAFGASAQVMVCSYGNVIAATSFLQGLAVEDLPDPTLLERDDPDYPVLVGAVAVKQG